MQKSLAIVLIGATVLLSACFGSDDYAEEAPAPPPPVAPVPPVIPVPPVTPGGTVPPGATSSIEAFVAFLAGLMLSERDAPLTLDGVVPPTSETASPLPVN